MATILRASCSDPLAPEATERWAVVEAWLSDRGESVEPVAPGVVPWDSPDWWLVADPTGGSLARESLPLLMGGLRPSAEPRAWWSMSDNALVLNALLDRGVVRCLHGQPLTLAGRDAGAQRDRFAQWSAALRQGRPFPTACVPPIRRVSGVWPSAVALIGGNLTALERLGDTPWRPRPQGRALLLESLTCLAAHAPHRVLALVQDPWWEGIAGLVLGRFTHADRDDASWFERLLTLLPPDLPVARAPLIGHGSDAWTVPLGEPVSVEGE